MRADTAASGGIADHDIVDPPIGHEPERLNQIGDIGDVVIHRLHQQRPRPGAKLAKAGFRKRTAFHHARSIVADDDPGFDLLLAGKARQFVWLQRIAPIAPRIADEQGALLPMVAQEVIDIETGKTHARPMRPSPTAVKARSPSLNRVRQKSRSSPPYRKAVPRSARSSKARQAKVSRQAQGQARGAPPS